MPAIRSVDRSAQLLVGALAPRAAPLSFLRRLGCMDSRYRRIRTGACRHFHPITATALAYHPHSVTYAPLQPFPGANDADLASLGRLEAVLDRLRRAGRLRVDRSLWLDEYGYQTNPPDPFLGVSPAKQDRWLQQAAYITLAQPAREAAHAVRVAGRARGARLGVLGLAVGPALCRRSREAGAGALPGAVLPRQAARRAVGPGAPGRRASGARAAPHARRRVDDRGPRETDARGYWVRRIHFVRGASYRFVPADGATHASATRSAG